MTEKDKKIITSIFFVSIYTTAFYLFYQLSLNFMYQTDLYLSDHPSHMRNMINIFKGELHFSYPIWHYLVKLFTLIFSFDIVTSSAFVSASIVTIYAILIYKTIHNLIFQSMTQYFLIALFITFILLVIGPLSIPNYNKYYILGQWSPNIWYSPTFIMLKPFALISLVFIIKTLKSRSSVFAFVTISAAIFSIFSKPSFIIIFVPAILIFYILRKEYINKYNTIFISLLFLSTIGAILFQYSLLFVESNVKILIDPFGVWSYYAPSIGISLLLGLAFPLLYLLLYYKRVFKDDYTLFSWILGIISILIALIFAESGERYLHGNFFWSYATSLNFLYIFTLSLYVKHFDFKEFKVKLILVVLIAQTFFGLKYLIHILQGGYAL